MRHLDEELPMLPLFDSHSSLRAWTDSDHVFDTSMNWIGYIKNNEVFRIVDSSWVGPWVDGTIRDQSGKAILWAKGSRPTSGVAPINPLALSGR
jgi:hypothetical protein